jgi:hypothetical protein
LGVGTARHHSAEQQRPESEYFSIANHFELPCQSDETDCTCSLYRRGIRGFHGWPVPDDAFREGWWGCSE